MDRIEINKKIEFYINKKNRKERLIKEYIEEKNSIDGFKSPKRSVEYYMLKSEIDLIYVFLEDLKDLLQR